MTQTEIALIRLLFTMGGSFRALLGITPEITFLLEAYEQETSPQPESTMNRLLDAFAANNSKTVQALLLKGLPTGDVSTLYCALRFVQDRIAARSLARFTTVPVRMWLALATVTSNDCDALLDTLSRGPVPEDWFTFEIERRLLRTAVDPK